MPDLQKLKFRDLGQLFDGPHATPARMTSGPYFLNIASLNSGRLDLSQSDHISEDDYPRWTKRVVPRGGDLLLSYETRLGEAALMPSGVRACLGRRMALVRPHIDVVDPRFLLYYYLSPAFQNLILRNTIHGATVTRIGLTEMPNWEVEVPGLMRQKAIAEVLGALDDKIAANERLLGLTDTWCELEVHRSAVLAEPKPLRDVLTLHYGKALPASTRTEGRVRVYGSGGDVGSHDHALVARSGIVVGRKGTAGVVHWVDGPHFPIDTTFYVEAAPGVVPEILYYILRKVGLGELNSDSAVPGLNRDDAYAQIARVPFDANSSPLASALLSAFESMRALRSENRFLRNTRDELLPLLMSGRISIATAEGEVSNVV